MSEKEQWAEWAKQLQDPFDPEDVSFRIATGSTAVAYADARTYAQRLDDVVGAGNWSFDWTPIHVSESGRLLIAKGILTIGDRSKADVGQASNQDGNLGCVSHCFKRACVQWGVGRYLYSEESERVAMDGKQIAKREIDRLRSKLPRPQFTYESGQNIQREDSFIVEDSATRTDTRATTVTTVTAEPAQPIREVAREAGLRTDESYQRAAKDYAGEKATKADYERVRDLIQRDIQARSLLTPLGVTPPIYEQEREKRTGHKAPYGEKDLVIMEAWVKVMQQEADDALADASYPVAR